MADPERGRENPADYLFEAAEALLRAGLSATRRARMATATSRGLEDLVDAWIRRRPALLFDLTRALDAEADRWDARALDDPAARRVRDVMRALGDVLRPEGDAQASSSARTPSGRPNRGHRAAGRVPR